MHQPIQRGLPATALVATALLLGAPPGGGQEEAGTQAGAPMMLKLKSGNILWGSIESHEPEAIEFRRLDNQGLVRMPWSFLDPDEERQLRLRFGYVESQADELMTDAERVVLNDGTEIVGLIVNRTADHIWFKRAEGTIPIDKRRVKGQSTIVQLPALEIFTKEELYQQKAFELQQELLRDGAAGARAHDELAQFAERLLDYPHAVEHYGTARKLDPELDPARLSAALARAERKAALQEQVDVLAEIDLMRARGRYDKALELLGTFPELYPDTPLLEDWNKLKNRVARYQERDLREEIVRRVNYWSVRLAQDFARKAGTFEEAIAYLDEKMAEDLIEHVKNDVQQIAPGIEDDQVRRLWDERKSPRARNATYSIGTWLLGEDRALEQYDKEEEPQAAPEKGSAGEARKKLEERVARYLKNQELARRASGGTSDEEDPNALWQHWTHSGRYQWMLAYFAEFSGLFKVEKVRFEFCRECGGSGTRTVLFTGSAISGTSAAETIVPCGTCHTLGHVRRIRYR